MVVEGNIRLLMFAVEDVTVGVCLAKAECSANAFTVQVMHRADGQLIHDIHRMPQDATDIKIHGPFFNLTMNIGSMLALPALSNFVKKIIRLGLLAAWVINPAMTTQDASSQSQANSLTNVKNGLNESFPGASGTYVERTISLDKVVEVELTCILNKKYSYSKSFQVTWKRGNETISHTSKTDNSWSIRVSVSDSSKLGNYSCTLKGEKQLSGIFHLQVPKIERKEKPTISYLRYPAVMTCECHGYTAISWTWYMTNGSKQIVINESLLADRYVISKKSASITELKILKLTKEDGGEYSCEATFELGKSEGRLKLKVLSFMAPLKPFIAIVIEVVTLVALIVCYEIYSTKVKRTEAETEFDQIEHLNSEDGGLESSEARQRRI
ncbi:embigin [Melopsittacus undulatus]|uniref:embigin n=1 Tax=Melopsittacus undulatus TaxID=13146 RepID=UPI0012437232|nr:embigin [Melopsittacus undulatus]